MTNYDRIREHHLYELGRNGSEGERLFLEFWGTHAPAKHGELM